MDLAKKIDKINIDKANLYAFWLHFLSGLGIAIFFGITNNNINFNTNLYTYKITGIDEFNNNIEFDFGNNSPNFNVSTVSLKTITILIFFITAIFHLFYYRNKEFYRSELEKGRNRIRWIEYGITATLMIFLLCIISGVKEIYATLLLCCLNICLISFGYFLEMSDSKEVRKICLVLGFFVLICTFTVILNNFYPNLNSAREQDYDIPSWVKMVLIPMIFWWASFGIVAILNTKNFEKKNYNFIRYERYYILLSYMSKAFMGYYLAFGLTRERPEKNN